MRWFLPLCIVPPESSISYVYHFIYYQHQVPFRYHFTDIRWEQKAMFWLIVFEYLSFHTPNILKF